MLAKLSDAALLPTVPLAARFLGHVAQAAAPLALFPGSTSPQKPIATFLLKSTAEQIKGGSLARPAPLFDLENVGPWGELEDLQEVDSIGSTRIRFNRDQLITTRLRPYLQKTVLLDVDDAIGSPEWISLRINEGAIRPAVLFYILQSKQFIELTPILCSGKEHPRITEDILNRIQIPSLPLDEQDALLAKLDPLADQANALLRGADRLSDAVDSYFAERFGLLSTDIDPLREAKMIELNLSRIAESRDARFSFKYHSPSVGAAWRRLRSISTHRMRDFLSGPAVLGDSVSPENYDSGSGRLYLSMVAVKHWRLDTSNLNEISEDYYQEHASKGVLAGDVLMARSGEGTIGKVGYALSDTGGICADFMIRMRPKSDIIRPAFLYYSLVSNYYQRLIYGEKKGLGNNTNIFPNQIHEFPIIDVCIADQDTIIRDLNAIVAKFDADILKARRLRNEIEFHLVKAMSA